MEENVKKLVGTKQGIECAMIQLSSANVDYESWLVNDGFLLTDLPLEKKQKKDRLNERICF